MKSLCKNLYPLIQNIYKYLFNASLIFLAFRIFVNNMTVDNWTIYDFTATYLVILPIIVVVMQVTGAINVIMWEGLIKIILKKDDDEKPSENFFLMYIFGFIFVPILFYLSTYNEIAIVPYVIFAIVIPSVYALITMKCEK